MPACQPRGMIDARSTCEAHEHLVKCPTAAACPPFVTQGLWKQAYLQVVILKLTRLNGWKPLQGAADLTHQRMIKWDCACGHQEPFVNSED